MPFPALLKQLSEVNSQEFKKLSRRFLTVDGSASAPSHAFDKDLNTGTYRVEDDILGFAAGGTSVVQMGDAWLRLGPQVDGTPVMFNGVGSNSAPGYTFSADHDTGMYRISANIIGWAVGGTREMSLSAGTFEVPNVYNDSVAGTADVLVESNGRLRRATSARKYKQNIVAAPELADIELVPIKYESKESGQELFGFIADDVAAQDSRLGVYGDGEIENFDTRGVMAVMAAKLNDYEQRIIQLEAKLTELVPE